MDKAIVSFEVPEITRDQLKKLAEQEHRSVSQQIRFMIEKFLEEAAHDSPVTTDRSR
jgi:predicted DNA-binding protein